MQRKLIIAGNFKMNKTATEAVAYARQFLPAVAGAGEVDIVLCPPFTALRAVADLLGSSAVSLGAQDVHWEPSGAYTGEVSTAMLRDAGCRYVIIGHSERRALFGETNQTVNLKVRAALAGGLVPIMCVGETLAEREAGRTSAVVEDHVRGGLAGLAREAVAGLIIAYEPVWAIGTGKTATPAQAEEVHRFIRELVGADFGGQVAARLRIQYGGSVKPGNIAELTAQPNIDGGLVGGACLDARDFATLIQNARRPR